MFRAASALLLVLLLTVVSFAQDRAVKVRQDKEQLADDGTWIYNDFERATADAKRTGKPLLVVVRCIPCEACSKFDKQLLAKQNEVRDLLEQFVCVRIVQANGLDLSLFQFDYDQSFHALLMNADKTIYGRFGTRSARPEQEDMTMAGLRNAMLGALDLHGEYPKNKDRLALKQPRPVAVRVPEEFPALKGKYTAKLDYEGAVVKSCIHCHQIRDAEREQYRQANKPLPDDVLFPYPLPDVLGLRMDPDQCATVASVEKNSIAAKAGLKAGDMIAEFGGHRLLSTADLQWALHRAGDEGVQRLEIWRGATKKTLSLTLEPGWRKQCDISWRPTTWELRRVATGGLVLEDLTDDKRTSRDLAKEKLALRVKHVGQYGAHAAGKNAGFREDDVIVAVDGKSQRMTESQFLAAALARRPGESLAIDVLRGRDKLNLKLPMQQ